MFSKNPNSENLTHNLDTEKDDNSLTEDLYSWLMGDIPMSEETNVPYSDNDTEGNPLSRKRKLDVAEDINNKKLRSTSDEHEQFNDQKYVPLDNPYSLFQQLSPGGKTTQSQDKSESNTTTTNSELGSIEPLILDGADVSTANDKEKKYRKFGLLVASLLCEIDANNFRSAYKMLANIKIVKAIQSLNHEHVIELITIAIRNSMKGNDYFVDKILKIIHSKYHHLNELQSILKSVHKTFKNDSQKHIFARALLEEYICDFNPIICSFISQVKARNYLYAFEMLEKNINLVNEIKTLSSDHLIALFKILINHSTNGTESYLKCLVEIIKEKNQTSDEFQYTLQGICSILRKDCKKHMRFMKLMEISTSNSKVSKLLNILANKKILSDSILSMLHNDNDLRQEIKSLNQIEATELIIHLISKSIKGTSYVIKKCLILINKVNVINELFEHYKTVDIDKCGKHKYNGIITMLSECLMKIRKKTVTPTEPNSILNLPEEFNQPSQKFPKPQNMQNQLFGQLAITRDEQQQKINQYSFGLFRFPISQSETDSLNNKTNNKGSNAAIISMFEHDENKNLSTNDHQLSEDMNLFAESLNQRTSFTRLATSENQNEEYEPKVDKVVEKQCNSAPNLPVLTAKKSSL